MTLRWIEMPFDNYRLMTEMTREQVEYLDSQARREAWDLKHPRCEECGQFIGAFSHFWKDYWGEVHHI